MRLLVAIANHGTKNQKFVEKLISIFRAYPFDTDIVVNSNIAKDFGPDVEVIVGAPTSNPRSLPFAHRRIFVERQDDYDLFLYTEDDMELTEAHIRAFVDATSKLPDDCLPGFMRYEFMPDGSPSYPDIHGPYRWDAGLVIEADGSIFARYTNEHSGCYLLTRAQLKTCIRSGNYDVAPHEGRYRMLESAATDPYVRCGYRKVICISDPASALIHHLPDLYVGRLGIDAEQFAAELAAVRNLVDTTEPKGPLFNAETALPTLSFDRNYQERTGREIAALISGSGKRILTVGCEHVDVETHLAGEGHDVRTIPMDTVFAAAANAHGIRCSVPDFDLALADLGGEKFDYIVFDDVLSHVADPSGLLRRFGPLLMMGGRALIVFVNAHELSAMRQRRKFDSLSATLFSQGSFAQTGYHFATGTRVRRWLRSAGLRPVRTEYLVSRQFAGWSRRSLGIADAFLSEIAITEALMPR